MKLLARAALFSLLASTIFPISMVYAQDEMAQDMMQDSADGAPTALTDEELAEMAEFEDEEIEEASAGEEMVEEEEKVMTVKEAKAMLKSLPTSQHAVGGTVPLSNIPVYDAYSRQLQYRENAKELRESLEARRTNFAKPSSALKEQYRSNREKIFAAENAEAAKAQQDKNDASYEDEEVAVLDEGDETMMKEDGASMEEEGMSIDVKEVKTGSEGSLTEHMIPQEEGEDVTVKKKVITSDDAPEFDPANLPH